MNDIHKVKRIKSKYNGHVYIHFLIFLFMIKKDVLPTLPMNHWPCRSSNTNVLSLQLVHTFLLFYYFTAFLRILFYLPVLNCKSNITLQHFTYYINGAVPSSHFLCMFIIMVNETRSHLSRLSFCSFYYFAYCSSY